MTIALVGALALVGSLVFVSASLAKSERTLAGTVVIGHDQEPSTLNNAITPGNAYTTSLVTNLVLASGQIYNDKATFVPQLFTAAPKLLKSNPLTVSFSIKPNAVWDDGRQVTGADFKATYAALMNPKWDITSREGWEDIRVINATGKNVTIIFKKPYAAWENLISTNIYPAHKIAGADFNNLFKDSISVSSGPYKFSSWQKGTQLVLTKNTKYKATAAAKLDRIVFRYIPNTASLFQALKSKELQVTEPQPQLQIVEMRKDTSNFKVQSGPGYFFEHLDLQFGAKGHPALKQPYIRKALITGMNRDQIKQALYVTPGLVANAKELPVLQSLIWKPFEPTYKAFFQQYKFNQQSVIDQLKKGGCTGGPDKPSASNSAIWSCPNVGKLSFRFFTTSGNQLRALTFEIIQKQLKSVGVELVPRFGPASQVFGQVLPSGDWDMFMFTWLGGPTSSITAFGLYGCGGDQNYMNYCNKKASDMLSKAQFTPDKTARVKLLHDAETLIAKDVPSIPMYVRPGFLINSTNVTGPVANPTQQGSTWNSNGWSVK